MTAHDLIGLFIEPLEGTGIPYMITGGVASVIYGDPRFTRDVDVVLELSPAEVPRLAEAFKGDDYYVHPLEMLEAEAARSRAGRLNVIHRASGSDRHLRDIAMMLRIRGDLMDATEMDRWLTELHLGDAFRQAQGYEPT